MKSTLRAIALLTALAPAGAALAQAPTIREGLWEISIVNEVPGQKSPPPITMKQCITSKQVEELQKRAQQLDGDGCKLLDQKTSGNTTTWRMECVGKRVVTGTGSMTVAADRYTLQNRMTLRSEGGKTVDVASTMSGQRLGDCKP